VPSRSQLASAVRRDAENLYECLAYRYGSWQAINTQENKVEKLQGRTDVWRPYKRKARTGAVLNLSGSLMRIIDYPFHFLCGDIRANAIHRNPNC
jgi:hypothetical protein